MKKFNILLGYREFFSIKLLAPFMDSETAGAVSRIDVTRQVPGNESSF
jgi:hypothetical protein